MLIESRFPGPWLIFCMLGWATLSLSHCLSFPCLGWHLGNKAFIMEISFLLVLWKGADRLLWWWMPLWPALVVGDTVWKPEGLQLFLFFFFQPLPLFYFIFPFIFISWRLITLQCCSGFCLTLTWISHGFTCVPHPDPPSPSHPSGSSQCTSLEHLSHASNLGWRCFTLDNIHVSMLVSQIIPPLPLQLFQGLKLR